MKPEHKITFSLFYVTSMFIAELFIIIMINPFLIDLVAKFADELGYGETKTLLLKMAVTLFSTIMVMLFTNWLIVTGKQIAEGGNHHG